MVDLTLIGAFALWEQASQPLQWSVVLGGSLAAAVLDVSRRRIPNALTVPLWAGGVAWAAATGGAGGAADALAGCVLAMIPCVMLFLLARGGAGDAKIMGAMGAWLGVVNSLVMLAGVSLAGLLLAGMWSGRRGQFRTVAVNVGHYFLGLSVHVLGRLGSQGTPSPPITADRVPPMPFGLAIFAGACLAAIGVFLWRA